AAVQFRRGNVAWKIEEGFADLVSGSASPDWFALDHWKGATRAKVGHRREVWRVAVAGGEFFAKVHHFPEGGIADVVRGAWGLTAAHREWRATREALRRGAPVIHVIALGSRGGRRAGAVLISVSAEGAESLADAWLSTPSDVSPRNAARVRRGLLEATAQLFAAAHARGVVHEDGHPSNILVERRQTEAPVARFADLGRRSITKGRASLARVVESLAQLDQYFHREASARQRVQFLKRYLGQFGYPAEAVGCERAFRRSLALRIEAARRQHALRLARRRDRRIGRNGVYFATIISGPGLRATVALKLSRRRILPEPQVPDHTIKDWDECLQSVAYAFRTGEPITLPGSHERFRVVTERSSGVVVKLAWMLFGAPQRREFARLHRQRHRDLAGPLPLAYVEHRCWWGGIDATCLILHAGG
ncbi:MAG: lipopolysaccharide kinase InaA family protein, partial [Planctomycetota bacterium]